MLVVGLTGELGSGKSTVAQMLAERGARVLSSDAMGRALMEPGQAVYRRIVETFGPTIVRLDGQLDRPALASLAFDAAHPRIEALNAIVHPAVLAEQSRLVAAIAAEDARALIVIESALIFTTRHAGGEGAWRDRFDFILLVTAPEEVEVQRFVQRATGGKAVTAEEEAHLRADAQARLRAQRVPPDMVSQCVLIQNAAGLKELSDRTEEVFQWLRSQADDRD